MPNEMQPAAEPRRSPEPPLAGLGKPQLPTLTRLTLIEHQRQIWTCKSPSNDAEDLLRTEFWKLAASKLTRHDIIYVIAEDESWEAECRVEAAYPDGAEISVVKKMSRKAVVQRQTLLGDGKFITRYTRGSWGVVRVNDQHIMTHGFGTENGAILDWERSQPRKVY